MRYILSLYLCLLFFNGAAQDCNCYDNLGFMVSKVEKNYAGFNDKITALNNKAYKRFTDSLLKVAAREKEVIPCLALMRKWLDFFKDKHMAILVNEDTAHYSAIRKLFSHTPTVKMPEQELKAYLDKGVRDSLEGIWEDESGTYRMGIMRSAENPGSKFTAFILRADSLYWMPGQVKATLQKTGGQYKVISYLKRDHTKVFAPPATVAKDSFSIGEFGTWYKVFPGKERQVAESYHPYFKVLDDTTCLLAIPSALLTYKGEIDSIMNRYDSQLRQTKHLILDLRNNGGGSFLCFDKLWPFIYTNPIITKGGSVLATEDNIRHYYEITDFPNISDSMKAVFAREAKELWEHKGTLYKLWKGDTTRFDTVLPRPARISVIINEYCASSTELFLLKALQSKKVKLYGRNTFGAVDYTDVVTEKPPCALFKLRYPTARSNELPENPIDNTGIRPHVRIADDVKDWVDYVRKQNHGS